MTDKGFLEYAKIEVYDVRDPADDGLRERLRASEEANRGLCKALKQSQRREFWWVVAFWIVVGDVAYLLMRAR